MISNAPKIVLVGFIVTPVMLVGALAASVHYGTKVEPGSRHVTVVKGELDRTMRFRAGCDEGHRQSCAWAFGDIDRLRSRIAVLPGVAQNTPEAMLIKSKVQQLEDWRRTRIEVEDGPGPAYQLRLWAVGSAQRGQFNAAKQHLQAADALDYRNLPTVDPGTTGAGYAARAR